ncbi:hypothetical protein FW774_05100 (plasmid) [Pedobacter sp. BS3]|uniref:hypothetical protein n=1 Tax=Pedobacter sp. BS3 TaxID=2567937 RepID=UPI0011EC795A|nr:hypothetical protein [Pedobacter sp. BS3]TZF86423.1 hypothetical protein FW774_05100 [Pedobacter sp. BS3]
MLTTDLQLTEVFKTQHGAVYQSDADNCIYLDFNHKIACFRFACFQRLNKLVEQIDIAQMTQVDHPGIEIIFLHGCSNCYVLTVPEVLALKELLAGAFAMFQLNNIIQDCLYRLVV